MQSIRVRDLSFAYPNGVELLSSVSLELARGWAGVVGANGSGKSTLLMLLAARLAPEQGEIRVQPGDAKVVLCEQRVDSLGPAVSALASSHDGEAFRLRAELELEPDALVRWMTLSPGERKRWQIAGALYAAPDLLLLDEPTNHLDGSTRRLLAAALAGHRGLGVLVSHDRALLDALTSETWRITPHRIDVLPLPYSQAIAAWQEDNVARARERVQRRRGADHAAQAASAAAERRAGAERQRSSKRRMKGPRDHDGRSSLAKYRSARAEARHGASVASLTHKLAVKQAEAEAVRFDKELGRNVFVDYAPAPKAILAHFEARELCAGERILATDIKLDIRRDTRVRIVGDNGTGKSTLVRQIYESLSLPVERVLFLPQQLTAAQDRELLSWLRDRPPRERSRALSLLAALGVDPERMLASAAPSPGEARKLLLALGLGSHAWLAILDEPENHLDLPALQRLEAALVDYPGALILVTHDDPLAERLTTTRLRLTAS